LAEFVIICTEIKSHEELLMVIAEKAVNEELRKKNTELAGLLKFISSGRNLCLRKLDRELRIQHMTNITMFLRYSVWWK
jgi:hypothetical protein